MQHSASVVVVTGLALLASAGGLADNATGAAPGTLAEVVVTATKTGAVNLQDVPVAITALTAATVRDANVENLTDLTVLSPGLQVTTTGPYIRGVGTNLVYPGSESSVTVHVDGVYLGRPGAVFSDFFPVERVEVLRGPQGTLYGRNSAGGTINIVPRAPSERLEAEVAVEGGNFGRTRGTAYVAGPLVSDRLLGGLSGFVVDSDSFVDNANPAGPADLSSDDRWGIRGVLVAMATDQFKATLSADYISDSSTEQFKQTGLLVDGSPALAAGAPGFPPAVIDPDFYTLNIPGEQPLSTSPGQERINYGFAAKLEWSPSDRLAITSLSSYRHYDYDYLVDSDYSEVPEMISRIVEDQWQASQELQLNYRTDRTDVVAGMFYFRENSSLDASIFLPALGLALFGSPILSSDVVTTVDTTAWAAFGQVTYALRENVNITGGIRYSHEEKEIDQMTGLRIGGPFLNPSPFGDRDSWGAWTPKLSVDLSIRDGLMIYGSASRGFKSGGYNFSVSQTSFDPEYLRAYEVGFKAELPGGRARLNGAAFYYDYSDLQVQQFVTAEDGVARVEITNAASARVKGLELELVAAPVPQLQVGLGLTWLEPEYSDFVTERTSAPDVPVRLDGNRLTAAPEWSVNVFMDFNTPLANSFVLKLRTDYGWRDRQFFTPFNDRSAGQSAYGLLNVRAAVVSPGDRWEFSVYARNLLDEEYTTGIQDFTTTGMTRFITRPRTFGAELAFRL